MIVVIDNNNSKVAEKELCLPCTNVILLQIVSLLSQFCLCTSKIEYKSSIIMIIKFSVKTSLQDSDVSVSDL